jgi:hypothetical protein
MASSAPSALTSLTSTGFAQELNTLREQYETNEQVRNDRNQLALIKANDYFLDKYVRSESGRRLFEESAREAASFGKKLVQLETWSGRGPVYQHQSLSDLLDFGDLCALIQDYLNVTYGEDEFRVFHYPIRNSRTTALTVSWDKAGFENADGIIRSNRERAQQRLEHRDHHDGDHREDRHRDDSGPRRRDYEYSSGDHQNGTPRRFQGRDRHDNDSQSNGTWTPRRNDQSSGPQQSWKSRADDSTPRNQGPPRSAGRSGGYGPRTGPTGPAYNPPASGHDQERAGANSGAMRPRRRLLAN